MGQRLIKFRRHCWQRIILFTVVIKIWGGPQVRLILCAVRRLDYCLPQSRFPLPMHLYQHSGVGRFRWFKAPNLGVETTAAAGRGHPYGHSTTSYSGSGAACRRGREGNERVGETRRELATGGFQANGWPSSERFESIFAIVEKSQGSCSKLY